MNAIRALSELAIFWYTYIHLSLHSHNFFLLFLVLLNNIISNLKCPSIHNLPHTVYRLSHCNWIVALCESPRLIFLMLLKYKSCLLNNLHYKYFLKRGTPADVYSFLRYFKILGTPCPRAKCFFLIWSWQKKICKLNLIWSYLCTH